MSRPLRSVAAALLAWILPVAAMAGEPAGEPVPRPRGKLVFLVTGGVEDLHRLQGSFKHARLAAESGLLESVVWLGYGRSVAVFDPEAGIVPASVRDEARRAKAAGVQLVVCANSLRSLGIDAAALDPQAEVVPAGAVELARLVSQGYEVVAE